MKRSSITTLPEFFDRYINLVEDMDINEVLLKYKNITSATDIKKIKQLGDYTYEEGKWTTRQIFQHIIDNERVQAYRALRIARNDLTPLPGYDENIFAQHARVEQKSIDGLAKEFQWIRASNIELFKYLNDQELQRIGNCNNQKISVLALGFVLVGHQKHHIQVIKERYL